MMAMMTLFRSRKANLRWDTGENNIFDLKVKPGNRERGEGAAGIVVVNQRGSRSPHLLAKKFSGHTWNLLAQNWKARVDLQFCKNKRSMLWLKVEMNEPLPPQNLTKLFILVFICQPFGYSFYNKIGSFVSGGPYGPKREPPVPPWKSKKSLYTGIYLPTFRTC